VIALTQLNGQEILVNPELIERVEGGPDTVVVLTNGHRYVVRTPPDEIRDQVLAYRAEILRRAGAVLES
jgi:flagellar protein FlbD